jgi:pimeloyl-ACP methyl ester carboxylesterase
MPVVFVHGVPDTCRVWRPILERINRSDVLTLSLPGFGNALPAGFSATKEEYVAWLATALEQLTQPIDLVGHDWGSLLVVRIAATRPDLLRSWVGGGAPVSSDYIWHKAAQAWQTPQVGENVMTTLDAASARRLLVGEGVPDAQACETAGHVDDVMKDCILKLYRSAKDVFKEWEPELVDIKAPGLVIWGENDSFADPRFADRMGELTRARRVARLANCGHWWQCQKPDEVAALLADHWAHVSEKS